MSLSGRSAYSGEGNIEAYFHHLYLSFSKLLTAAFLIMNDYINHSYWFCALKSVNIYISVPQSVVPVEILKVPHFKLHL